MWREWANRSDTVRLLARSIKARLSKAADDRQHARMVLADRVECSLGLVVDVSRGGARVLAKQRFDGEGMVKIKTDGGMLVIQARVVWCARRGFRKYMLGLEFNGVTDEVSRVLESMATS